MCEQRWKWSSQDRLPVKASIVFVHLVVPTASFGFVSHSNSVMPTTTQPKDDSEIECDKPLQSFEFLLGLLQKKLLCRSSQIMNHFQAINHIQQENSLFLFF